MTGSDDQDNKLENNNQQNPIEKARAYWQGASEEERTKIMRVGVFVLIAAIGIPFLSGGSPCSSGTTSKLVKDVYSKVFAVSSVSDLQDATDEESGNERVCSGVIKLTNGQQKMVRYGVRKSGRMYYVQALPVAGDWD